jgi:hypothetical protein
VAIDEVALYVLTSTNIFDWFIFVIVTGRQRVVGSI